MPSGSKTRERVQKFGELLKAPFHRNRSRSSSPSPGSAPVPAFSNALANTPDTTVHSNVISGSLIRGSASSTGGGVASSSTLVHPAHATGVQPPGPQSPTISVPVKNEAFQKAIQKYIDNLPDDDKDAFQSATDVMKKLGELQQDNSRISSSHTTRVQKVQKVLQCVQQFLGSIAICIQHSPEISSLVVGGLHCILTVSTYPH